MKTITQINQEFLASGKSPTKQWIYFAMVWAVIAVIGIALLSKPSAPSAEDTAAKARLYAISFGQMSIEQTLKDPSSVQYSVKAYNLTNDSLCYSYSAKNGFGGRVNGYTVIRDGKSFGGVKAFDKYCSANSNYEKY